MNPYLRFALMLTTSFVVMYAVMFANVDVTEHIMLSPTRTYMTILMVAPMAIIMLLYMWKMYKNKTANYLIIGVSVLLTAGTYHFLRQQIPIGDVAWMKAMIPHHSSAIMVSEKADLDDPEARALAKDIIEAQKEEIARMKAMIQRLEQAE